jgi:transposase
MNNFQIFIGIDVSKEHLDFALYNPKTAKNSYLGRCSSNYKAIGEMVKKICTEHKGTKILFCMEATGYYSEYVAFYLHQEQFFVWVENALHIKRSLGLIRGKNDKVDSERIAEYAYRYADKFLAYNPPSEPISKLQRLQRLRENLVECKKKLETQLKEAKRYVTMEEMTLLHKHSEASLSGLQENIKAVSRQINEILYSEEDIAKNFDLICSVPGVGQVTATELIIATRNFTLFEKAEKLACYCGVAPFGHSSGKITGRKRVSNLADKRLKTLLHMCAVSILSRKKGELYDYYVKKTGEGKNKRLVINALRNKLIHRIFACVSKGVAYEPDYKYEPTTQKNKVIVDSAMAKKTHGGGIVVCKN